MTMIQWALLTGFFLGFALLLIFLLNQNLPSAVGGVAFLLGIGCVVVWMWSMSQTSVKKENEPPVETASIVPYSELYYAYKENEIVADEEYKGNRYLVTGEIAGISNDGLLNLGGGATLTVHIKVDRVTVVLIASFDKTQVESLKSVKVGDTVTFAGKCLSYGSWSDCELV